MLGFKKNKQNKQSAGSPIKDSEELLESQKDILTGNQRNIGSSSSANLNKIEVQEQGSFFSKLRSGLDKTRQGLARGLGDLLLGRKEIDDELLEDIETQLLLADVGVDATRKIINSITEQVARKELLFADALYDKLKEELLAILQNNQQKLPNKTAREGMPYVILVVGVNGVGKTTTIGKLAKLLQGQGKQVMLAAGDTFRAAAVEQLQVWGERNAVPVVAQHTGADSASVIFDALQSARSRGMDILIADTAGRLHNKSNLMEELSKVKRVLQKIDPDAPHEVMLVIDASTGQNALSQVKQFKEAVNVDSLVVTKLDGTAKGGIVFAIADQCHVPIKYIGVGEQIDDLRPFEQEQFVNALFLAD
jgi:fused signal recognition particle receptor